MQFLKNKGQLIFSGVAILLDGMGDKKTKLNDRLAQFKKAGKFQLKTDIEIPHIIEKVCIITSNQSAAHHDILSILSKTPHTFESILIPSSVQGLLAPGELQQALSIAESLSPDVICISRGGGAEQDFDCFFDESLANQISNSKTAILTGIGHEINTTLSCLCANKHFETPTALAQWLANYSVEPLDNIKKDLTTIKQDLLFEADALKLKTNQLCDLALSTLTDNQMLLEKEIALLQQQIIHLNPILRLDNGFIYCENKDNEPVKTVQQIQKNDTIYMTLVNGKAEATINHVSKKTN